MPTANHVNRGWQLLDDGEVAGARRAARQALRADSGSLEAMLLHAACERAEGRLGEAERQLRHLTEADPTWAPPVLWLAEILADDPERRTEALRRARKAVELAADDQDERLRGTVLVARLSLDGGGRGSGAGCAPAGAGGGRDRVPGDGARHRRPLPGAR